MGDYLNGEKNGKAIEYFDPKKISFIGEVKNGIKNGNGKEYDYYGKL